MTAGNSTGSSLDPRWTERIYGRTTGEDFLGLRSVQANIVGYLLPGIITITPRARYYPFYSWLLVEYGQSHPAGMPLHRFIRRREQVFVLANLAWSASNEEEDQSGLLGSIKLGRHWREHLASDPVPLSCDDYLAATYGGYTQYVGVMRALGLTRQHESGSLDILPQGQQLAQAFAEAITGTRYWQKRASFDTAASIPRSVLEEYGASCRLSGLSTSCDRDPTMEVLFAFGQKNLLPPPDAAEPAIENMRGTLGLILDMVNQTQGPFTDEEFRQAVAYGLCPDYQMYRPSEALCPILAHWQIFQLREYYVYALYALWVRFLSWLRDGPQTLQAYRDYLSKNLDLTESALALGFDLPKDLAANWTLRQWFSTLLDTAEIAPDDWTDRCRTFARKSSTSLNEHRLYRLLQDTSSENAAAHTGAIWLLLSVLYLRLRGLRDAVPQDDSWYWARFGDRRRRSLDLYVREMDGLIAAGQSVLDALAWLHRDYIVAQHIVTALEKWRQRKANTFHFDYDRGIFEWNRDGVTGFSASRFRQAYTMLADLGLLENISEDRRPSLTDLGRKTLERALEACDG